MRSASFAAAALVVALLIPVSILVAYVMPILNRLPK